MKIKIIKKMEGVNEISYIIKFNIFRIRDLRQQHPSITFSNIKNIFDNKYVQVFLKDLYPKATINQRKHYTRNYGLVLTLIKEFTVLENNKKVEKSSILEQYYPINKKYINQVFKKYDLSNNINDYLFTKDGFQIKKLEVAERTRNLDKFGSELQQLLDELITAENIIQRQEKFLEIETFMEQNFPTYNGYYQVKIVLSDNTINYLNLNRLNMNDFLQGLKNAYVEDFDTYNIASGELQKISYNKIINVTILSKMQEYVLKEFRNRRRDNRGAIFPFLNKVENLIDLKKFQIYSQDSINNDENKENCLIYALKNYNLTPVQHYEITRRLVNNFFPKKNLNIIAKILEKNIILHELVLKTDNKYKFVIYEYSCSSNVKNKELTLNDLTEDYVQGKVLLGLLFNHYIEYTNVECPSVMLPYLNIILNEKHDYDEGTIQRIKDCFLYNKSVKKVNKNGNKLKFCYEKNPVYIDSPRLIYLMYKNNLFEQIDNNIIEKLLEEREMRDKYLKIVNENKDYICKNDLKFYKVATGKLHRFTFDSLLKIIKNKYHNISLKEEDCKNIPYYKAKQELAPFYVFADSETYIKKTDFKQKTQTIEINKNVIYSHGFTIITKEQILNYLEQGKEIIPKIVIHKSDQANSCLKKFLNELNKIYEEYLSENKNTIPPVIYYHNLKFDLSLYGDEADIIHKRRIDKEGNIYSELISFFGKKYELRDSYKIISAPLKKFSNMFNLPAEKELLPYDLYTEELVEKELITLEELKNKFNNSTINGITYDSFIEHVQNIEKKTNLQFITSNKINMMKYNNYYLRKDVEVLALGFLKFAKDIYQLTYKIQDVIPKEDEEILNNYLDNCDKDTRKIIEKELAYNEEKHLLLFNYLTSSSLADDYLIKRGVYKNCTLLKNSVDKFIKKMISGGKVMCYDNKAQKAVIKEYNNKLLRKDTIKNCKSEQFIQKLQELKDFKINKEEFEKEFFSEYISDYDAVSCYPSAMYFMDGVPKGRIFQATEEEIKMINSEQELNKLTILDKISNKGHYYLSIKIKKCTRYSNFSSISVKKYKNDTYCGKQYLNEIPNELIYTDKYKLQELILNNGLNDFEVETMLYFPEGYDNKLKFVVKELFETRKQLKKEGNPLQEVYKLILNSAFGKTIMKASDNVLTFFQGTEEEMMEEWKKLKYEGSNVTQVKPGQFVFYRKNIADITSRAQVGVNILSYSKLLMLKVILTAEKNNLKIFYTDTDSVQMIYKDILQIKDKFYEETGQELDGKELGQFHVDYQVKDCDIVFGIAGIWLNKKSYCVILEGLNTKTGEITREEMFRFKGIKNEALVYYAKKWCKENNIDTNYPIYELYNSNKIHVIDQITEKGIQVKTYNKGLTSECLKEVLKNVDFKQYENTFDQYIND